MGEGVAKVLLAKEASRVLTLEDRHALIDNPICVHMSRTNWSQWTIKII